MTTETVTWDSSATLGISQGVAPIVTAEESGDSVELGSVSGRGIRLIRTIGLTRDLIQALQF